MSEQALRTDAVIRLAADDSEPTVERDGTALPIGREFLRDNGGRKFWNGSDWKYVSDSQKLFQVADLLIEIRDLLTVE